MEKARAKADIRTAYKAAVKHMVKKHGMPKELYPFEGHGTQSLESVWASHRTYTDCPVKFPNSLYDLWS